LLWLAVLSVFFSACLPPPAITPAQTPTQTETPTRTPSPTGTIVWFSPTSTFTPHPTIALSPTEDLRIDLGQKILEDDFTDQSAWPTLSTAAGSVAYGNQELTLAVKAPDSLLISMRQAPAVSDFFMEIDALPSLCRAGDSFGVLVRAESALDYYRLLINCNGQLRLERLSNGRALPLQDWTVSGQVPPGGMMRFRLGVWALNDEIRIYVNDVFQFSLRDPVWSSGQIGVFARSAGDTPLTVNFSRLVIYLLPEGRPLPAMPTTRPATPAPTSDSNSSSLFQPQPGQMFF